MSPGSVETRWCGWRSRYLDPAGLVLVAVGEADALRADLLSFANGCGAFGTLIFGDLSVTFFSTNSVIQLNAEMRPVRDDSGTIETRPVFRGRVLDLNVEHVRYPDGSEGRLEIVRHRGAAAALPLFRPGEWSGGPDAAVILIRQHRHATGGYLWELPAGKLDDGESPESCASREMEEEIGDPGRRSSVI